MEIPFIYVPALVCLLSWFLGWMFSGFADGLEAIAGNPITLIFSVIGYFAGLFSLIYYSYKTIMWVYHNITIVF
jgi:hypothetical protein